MLKIAELCHDTRLYKIYLNIMLLLCDDIQKHIIEETYLRETSLFNLWVFIDTIQLIYLSQNSFINNNTVNILPIILFKYNNVYDIMIEENK